MPENRRFRQTWKEHVCHSGLKVIVIEKKGFSTSGAMLITPYGSLDYIQEDSSGREYASPLGTAHFLEHKLFESEDNDVTRQFSQIGANVNAFTSYSETAYYFTTGESHVEKPLNMLLDFVQNFAVTDASVEKERPIILEEYQMYQEDPDGRLFQESMRGLYHCHPIREDIVGTEASISAITRQDLEAAYARNYHPGAMTLVILSAADAEELIETVEKNQSGKQFPHQEKYVRKNWQEDLIPEQLCIETVMDVQSQKTAYSFKLNSAGMTAAQRLEMEWGIRFALDSWFTPMNPLFQTWLDEERITPYFSTDTDSAQDYAYLQIMDETAKADELREFILRQLNALCEKGISEEHVSQLKRRTIGSNIRLFDYPSELMNAWARSTVTNVSLFDEIDVIEHLTADRCMEILRSLDLSNPACAKLVSR
jgi:predicted Zn-dependent peptidase